MTSSLGAPGESKPGSSTGGRAESVETVLTIDHAGHRLIGIVHHGSARLGVVVVVGGGQYRVGAHRQFVRLARTLAADGIPTLRFDVRGMGDSEGERRHFLDLNDDLRVAIDAFVRAEPRLDGVVLWGLCDGASAALLYADNDPRVQGVVMVNPWISTDEGAARTYLRHHYRRRLADPAFWRKLGRGQIDLPGAMSSFVATLRSVLRGSRSPTGDESNLEPKLPDLVFASLGARAATTLVVVSSDDLTAREFEDELDARTRAGQFSEGEPPAVERLTADHTFSTPDAHAALCAVSLRWLDSLLPPEAARLR